MKATTKTIGIIVVFLAVLLITGCQGQTQDTIKIGYIGPQTGSAAVLGMDGSVAAQIAIDRVNSQGGVDGKQVELIVEDDQYNVKNAISAYNKLVNVDKVDVILINTYGSVFALADQAEKDGVTLLDPLDCNNELAKLGSHVFCLATESESIANVLEEYAEQNEMENVGVLYFNSDTFMPLIENVFEKEFDGNVVLSESYTAGTTDFKTSITKMLNKNVDAIVLLGYDETGIAMKQARELGFKGQFLTTGTVTSPSLQEAAAGNAEGTVFAFWDAPKDREPAKSFTEEFIARQGRAPILDLASYPSYDAVTAVVKALENGENLNEEIPKVQFDGVTGKVSFENDGSVRIKESAFILNNGMPKKL